MFLWICIVDWLYSCRNIVGPNDLDPKDTGFDPPRPWGLQLYKIPRLYHRRSWHGPPPFFQLIPSLIKSNACSFTDENVSRFFWDNGPNKDVFIIYQSWFSFFFFWIKTGKRDFLLDIYFAYKSFVWTAALGLEISGSNDIVLILPLY
jgi:hypothetical protein